MYALSRTKGMNISLTLGGGRCHAAVYKSSTMSEQQQLPIQSIYMIDDACCKEISIVPELDDDGYDISVPISKRAYVAVSLILRRILPNF